MDDARDEEAVAALRAELARAVGALAAAGARDEALAVYVPRRRKLGVPLEPVLRPVGRVWRLGVLLLDAEGGLHATGQLVRATPPGRTQYVSVSAETRRALRAAAQRGHFTEGETVNFDAEPIPLDAQTLRDASGPLLLAEGRLLVRWSPSGEPVDALRYLAERVELLADPPAGA